MNKASRYVPIRIPMDVWDEMELTIRRAEQYRRDEPWNTTTFIITAIREKLAKMDRSRRSRSKGKKSE